MKIVEKQQNLLPRLGYFLSWAAIVLLHPSLCVQAQKQSYSLNFDGGFTYVQIPDLKGNCLSLWGGTRFLSFINPKLALGPAITFYYQQLSKDRRFNEFSYTVGPLVRFYGGLKNFKLVVETSIEGGRIINRNSPAERFPIEKAFGLNGNITSGVAFFFSENWSLDILLCFRYYIREKRNDFWAAYLSTGLVFYLETKSFMQKNK
ncbi:MAG: hypothetical protein RML72_09845 [Bacteroidia bacterium]|nr:hypothetical protein [Bacteroidia bacterium]MDW8159158.1 hypothetical protein [Bacteroidia bacterium]